MADKRFFSVSGPFTLRELAETAAAETGGAFDPEAEIADVAALDSAGPDDISFLDNKHYVDAFTQSKARACVVQPEYAAKAPPGMALLMTPDPYRAFAKIASLFYPVAAPVAGIAPSAVVDPTAKIGVDCRIEANAVIGAGAEIGAGTIIGPTAVVGAGVVVGSDCSIGAGVTLAYCLLGNNVILHPGVRVGQDGFGFALGAGGHLKVPQLGRVIIEDDVEIGANTTVDRGAGPDTVIGAGTKIDNLVQIAHNVRVGRGCVIVSHVGISGSTKVGDFVMIGGQAGLTGHLSIGSGARIAAQSGVMRDVDPGATVCGSPAIPAREYWRQVTMVAGLGKKRKGE